MVATTYMVDRELTGRMNIRESCDILTAAADHAQGLGVTIVGVTLATSRFAIIFSDALDPRNEAHLSLIKVS